MKTCSSRITRLRLLFVLSGAVSLGLCAAGCDLYSDSNTDEKAVRSGLGLGNPAPGLVATEDEVVGPVIRDGGEATGLGAPSVAVSPGSGIVVAGVGTETLPASFNLNVPGTLEQALLYWAGEHSDGGADDTIDVEFNGAAQSVPGTLIGGPEFFFFAGGDVFVSTYRADVTGFVMAGANTIEVTGMDFDVTNNGVGLLVIFADGPQVAIDIRDGQDLAFANFAPPLDATVPQTFNFAPSGGPRNANLHLFASDVGADRPNRIQIDVSGEPPAFLDNLLSSADGPFWDTHTLSVAVPAGATSVTVEVISFDDGSGDLPASLSWIVGALTLEEPECGDGIVDPGEECDDANTNNFDDCRNDCTVPICGDGIVDPGEECDDGDTDDFDECRNDCTMPICGDGIVDPGEECDDGDTDDFDECRNDCTLPFCGDGILDPGEECDDGNNDAGDGCSPTCDVEDEDLEGCTLGYWMNHPDAWPPTGYAPGQSLDSVFTIPAAFSSLGSASLEDALGFGGGPSLTHKAALLLKQAVAALLSAAHPDVNYQLTEQEVIDAVDAALATEDKDVIEDLKDDLDAFNNEGCPLN